MKKRVILLFSIGIIFVLAVVFSSYHKTANEGEVNVDSHVISAATEGNSTYAITVDGVKSTSFPAKGLYRASVDCEGATGKWDYENWKLYVDDITGNISCDISFTSISKTYLTNKIIGLANTTQGNGKVIHESANLTYDNSTFTAGSKLSQSNYTSLSNDATYPWTWNSSYSAWTSSNKTDSTTSTLQFKVNSSGYYQICYKQSSEMNYDYGHLYKDGSEIYNLKGISNTSYQCRYIGYLTTSNVMKFTYSKDGSASNGSDEVSFYLQGGTYNENISTTNTDTGYRYEGKNPNNYIWFNNELWRIIGVFGSGSHGQSGNLTKIVRETPIGGLAFDKSNNNNWATSGLKRLLNGAYFNRQDGTGSGYCYGSTSATTKCNYSINGLTSKWRGMVRSVNWYLGGVSTYQYDDNYYTMSTENYYKYERLSKVYSGNSSSDTGYVGLIYPSDYGYATLSTNCSRTTSLTAYGSASCAGQNWMGAKGYEWPLSVLSNTSTGVNKIDSNGRLTTDSGGSGNAVRPVVYLDSNVYVMDGDGSITNPYIIERDGSVTIPPEVASVSTSVTSSSITFTTTAYQGTDTIKNYYYSVNGGSSWYSSASSSTSNTYTINGLASNTRYNLRVKLYDVNNVQSNIIWQTSATTLYASPSVTSVTVTGVGPTGFTINAYASAGSNSIKTYYFSTNGGSTWTSVNSSSTSYSKYFSANPSTTYSIAVKVYDTAGYVSNTYTTSVTTSAYLYPSVTNVTTSNVTATSFTVTATASAGTNSLNYYYFSIDGGVSWFSANTSNTSWSMSFGAKPSTTYSIAVKVYDTAGYVSSIYYTSVSTTYMTMPAYIQSLYVGDTYNYLIYHNESGSPVYNNWGLELGDLSYRYYGANPNNYICYGTNTAPCPNDNLYRIIGVFGTQLKLIKYYSIGSYTWTGRYNADEYSYWENSYLNYGILNSNFLNNFSGNWLNWMYESRWENGGVDQPYLFYYNARTAGLYEIGPNRMYGGSYYAKVGLMYMSDYFFAADPIYWGYPGWDNYGNGNDYSLARYSNWMPTNAWSITRLADFNWFSATVESNGRTTGYRVGNMYFDVYPVFYITDSWWYKAGSGTYSDPYMIY